MSEEQLNFFEDFENNPENYSFGEEVISDSKTESYGELQFRVKEKKKMKAAFFKRIKGDKNFKTKSLDVSVNQKTQKRIDALLDMQDDYHTAMESVGTLRAAFRTELQRTAGVVPKSGAVTVHDGHLCQVKITTVGVSIVKLASLA